MAGWKGIMGNISYNLNKRKTPLFKREAEKRVLGERGKQIELNADLRGNINQVD